MYAPRKTWNLAAWRICRQTCGFSWFATVATRTPGCCKRVPPRKSAGACGSLTKNDALYCDVLAVLWSFFLVGGLVQFFPHSPCPFDAAQQTIFLAPSSLIGWLRNHHQQFPDLCHLLHCLPPHGPLPTTSWLRRPRPVPGPVLCVPPPSGWNGASPRWTSISAVWTCWFP